MRGSVSPSEPMNQGFLQGLFDGLGAGGAPQTPSQHLPGAAIQDRHERAPAVRPAFHQGNVRGPALVGQGRDGSGSWHTRAFAHRALADGPALDAHEAVNLLAIGGLVQPVLQPGPHSADAVGGVVLDDGVDGLGQGLVHRPVEALQLGLVVGRGARHAQNSAQAGHGDLLVRLEKVALHGVHEIPSGKSLPRMRCAFFRTSTSSASSPILACSRCFSASH